MAIKFASCFFTYANTFIQSRHSDSGMETSDQNKGMWIIRERTYVVQFFCTSKQADAWIIKVFLEYYSDVK